MLVMVDMVQVLVEVAIQCQFGRCLKRHPLFGRVFMMIPGQFILPFIDKTLLDQYKSIGKISISVKTDFQIRFSGK